MEKITDNTYKKVYHVLLSEKEDDGQKLLIMTEETGEVYIASTPAEIPSANIEDYITTSFGTGAKALLKGILEVSDITALTADSFKAELEELFFEEVPEEMYKYLGDLPEATPEVIEATAVQIIRDLDLADLVESHVYTSSVADLDEDLKQKYHLFQNEDKSKILWKDEDGGIAIVDASNSEEEILLAAGYVKCMVEGFSKSPEGTWVSVWRPKESKQAKTLQVVDAAYQGLLKYPEGNIDVVLEDSGMLSVMFHSHNNSFAIKQNVANINDCDVEALKSRLDEFEVGYNW